MNLRVVRKKSLHDRRQATGSGIKVFGPDPLVVPVYLQFLAMKAEDHVDLRRFSDELNGDPWIKLASFGNIPTIGTGIIKDFREHASRIFIDRNRSRNDPSAADRTLRFGIFSGLKSRDPKGCDFHRRQDNLQAVGAAIQPVDVVGRSLINKYGHPAGYDEKHGCPDGYRENKMFPL